MENTPLTDDVIVPKKNVLFEVTKVSRALATILFIALPFVGGWIGYTYGNNNSITEFTNSTEHNTSKQIVPPEIKEGKGNTKPSSEGFAVVGNNVVYQTKYSKPQIIDGLDIKSFESLNTRTEDNVFGLLYAKDTDSVFVGDHLGTILEINGADPLTFTILENNFARDNSSVYVIVETGGGMMFVPRIVKITEADTSTFTVLKSGYAKDKNSVYFSPWNQQEAIIVENADPLTFYVTDTPSYSGEGFKGKDSHYTYDFGKVEDLD